MKSGTALFAGLCGMHLITGCTSHLAVPAQGTSREELVSVMVRTVEPGSLYWIRRHKPDSVLFHPLKAVHDLLVLWSAARSSDARTLSRSCADELSQALKEALAQHDTLQTGRFYEQAIICRAVWAMAVEGMWERTVRCIEEIKAENGECHTSFQRDVALCVLSLPGRDASRRKLIDIATQSDSNEPSAALALRWMRVACALQYGGEETLANYWAQKAGRAWLAPINGAGSAPTGSVIKQWDVFNSFWHAMAECPERSALWLYVAKQWRNATFLQASEDSLQLLGGVYGYDIADCFLHQMRLAMLDALVFRQRHAGRRGDRMDALDMYELVQSAYGTCGAEGLVVALASDMSEDGGLREEALMLIAPDLARRGRWSEAARCLAAITTAEYRAKAMTDMLRETAIDDPEDSPWIRATGLYRTKLNYNLLSEDRQ